MGGIDCGCLQLGPVRFGDDLTKADLPEEAGPFEVRKFRTGSTKNPTAYRWQCQRCGRKFGRALDPYDLPGGLSPKRVDWARAVVNAAARPSSLQRRRSAKRRSSDFQAQRRRVMERDEWTCQGCGEDQVEALEVHHVRYPEIPEDDVPDSDLQTLCGRCNLAERNDRMAGGTGGRVGG